MSATPAGFSLLQVWALSGAAPASICRPVSHWEVICALWQLSLLGESYRSSVRFSSASLERRFNCFNLRNFQNQFDKTMEAGKRFMDVNLSNLSFIQTPEKKTEKKTASPSSVMDVAPWHERDAPVAWYDSFPNQLSLSCMSQSFQSSHTNHFSNQVSRLSRPFLPS